MFIILREGEISDRIKSDIYHYKMYMQTPNISISETYICGTIISPPKITVLIKVQLYQCLPHMPVIIFVVCKIDKKVSSSIFSSQSKSGHQ